MRPAGSAPIKWTVIRSAPAPMQSRKAAEASLPPFWSAQDQGPHAGMACPGQVSTEEEINTGGTPDHFSSDRGIAVITPLRRWGHGRDRTEFLIYCANSRSVAPGWSQPISACGGTPDPGVTSPLGHG